MHTRFAVFGADGSPHSHDNDAQGVTYNHATGILFRNQPYGVEPEHGVFAIQRALREDGRCTVNGITAVSWSLSGGAFRSLACTEVAIGIHRCGTSD